MADLRPVKDQDNSTADALSLIEALPSAWGLVYFEKLTAPQQADSELQEVLQNATSRPVH